MADDDSVNELTPKAAMRALTQVAVKAETLQGDLELVRLAFVGAIHEASQSNIPGDRLAGHFEPMLDKLVLLHTDTHDIAKLVRDAGVALYSLVEDQGAA